MPGLLCREGCGYIALVCSVAADFGSHFDRPGLWLTGQVGSLTLWLPQEVGYN